MGGDYYLIHYRSILQFSVIGHRYDAALTHSYKLKKFGIDVYFNLEN